MVELLKPLIIKRFSSETTAAWLLALQHKQKRIIPCHSWSERQQVLAVVFLTQPSKYQQWEGVQVFSFQNHSNSAGRVVGIFAKL